MEEIYEKIRPKLVSLNVGQSAVFPIVRMKSVRTQASELGAIMCRRYTTESDRVNRTLTVTRLK